MSAGAIHLRPDTPAWQFAFGFTEHEDRNAYKWITDNPIVLDFTGLQYIGEIHRELKTKLGLPDFYGANWDALWDLMRGFRMDEIMIEVHGLNTLPSEFDEQITKMKEVFDDVHEDSENIKFRYVD